MPRIRSLVPAATLTALALVGSACGVFADGTAATVLGRSVSASSVEELTRDEAFVGAEPVGATDGTLPGDLFRSVLAFELQRVASIAEAERWGVPVTDAGRDAARPLLESQMSAAGVQYDESTQRKLVDYLAAQSALEQRFSQLDPDDDEDLRRLYDGSPAMWQRVCVAVVELAAEQQPAVDAALAAGTTIEEIPSEVPGTGVAAEPTQCIQEDQVPDELLEDFLAAGVGENAGPVTIGASETRFMFRVDRRGTVGFDEARSELAQIARVVGQPATEGQPPGTLQWISVLVSSAEVDPRFGSEVVVGSDGQPTVVAPQAPLVTEPAEMLGAVPDQAP